MKRSVRSGIRFQEPQCSKLRSCHWQDKMQTKVPPFSSPHSRSKIPAPGGRGPHFCSSSPLGKLLISFELSFYISIIGLIITVNCDTGAVIRLKRRNASRLRGNKPLPGVLHICPLSPPARLVPTLKLLPPPDLPPLRKGGCLQGPLLALCTASTPIGWAHHILVVKYFDYHPC